MKKLYKAQNDEVLVKIVNILSKSFPNISLTTDLDYYPLDDGCIIVNVLGVEESEAVAAVNTVIPGYSLEAADRDEFTVFLAFNVTTPEKHDLRKVLL